MTNPARTASSAPAVSVVIPAYGHEELIGETLDTVFAQTFGDYEVVVVDDGSPDDTADRLAPLADAGRIRLVRQANAGQAAARNRGIALARERYVALLDDDDLWKPDKLAWQVEALEANPEAAICWGAAEQLLEDGTIRPPDVDAEFAAGFCPQSVAWGRMMHRCRLLSPGQSLIRRSALEAVGGFDPEIWGSDDWDLYLKLLKVGGAYVEPGRVCLTYRLHAGNASVRQAVRHAQNHLRVDCRHGGSAWLHPIKRLRARARAGRYYIPNLDGAARAALAAGDAAGARRAWGTALRFRPWLAARRSFWREVRAARRAAGGLGAGPDS